MPWRLSERTVLITGPARGIGVEVARQLAARGARISLVGLEPELGEGHATFEADVTDQSALERAAAATVERLGGIDIVVANGCTCRAASRRSRCCVTFF